MGRWQPSQTAWCWHSDPATADGGVRRRPWPHLAPLPAPTRPGPDPQSPSRASRSAQPSRSVTPSSTAAAGSAPRTCRRDSPAPRTGEGLSGHSPHGTARAPRSAAPGTERCAVEKRPGQLTQQHSQRGRPRAQGVFFHFNAVQHLGAVRWAPREAPLQGLGTRRDVHERRRGPALRAAGRGAAGRRGQLSPASGRTRGHSAAGRKESLLFLSGRHEERFLPGLPETGGRGRSRRRRPWGRPATRARTCRAHGAGQPRCHLLAGSAGPTPCLARRALPGRAVPGGARARRAGRGTGLPALPAPEPCGGPRSRAV